MLQHLIKGIDRKKGFDQITVAQTHLLNLCCRVGFNLDMVIQMTWFHSGMEYEDFTIRTLKEIHLENICPLLQGNIKRCNGVRRNISCARSSMSRNQYSLFLSQLFY